jgi:hypothetical protein
LRQFEPAHVPIALKLLESLDYYPHHRVVRELRDLAAMIRNRTGESLEETYFASFTEHGKSGDWIIADFRFAANLRQTAKNSQFIDLASLSDFKIIPDVDHTPPPPKAFVFLDDFIGSGDSAISTWGRIQSETNVTDRYYHAALVGTEDGMARIREYAPELNLVCNRILRNEQKVFADGNPTFTLEEKRILKRYCEIAYPGWPGGYKNTQSLTVFYQRCSNNVIPVIYGENEDWIPLFPRQFPKDL